MTRFWLTQHKEILVRELLQDLAPVSRRLRGRPRPLLLALTCLGATAATLDQRTEKHRTKESWGGRWRGKTGACVLPMLWRHYSEWYLETLIFSLFLWKVIKYLHFFWIMVDYWTDPCNWTYIHIDKFPESLSDILVCYIPLASSEHLSQFAAVWFLLISLTRQH